jgi:hypothetical protein
MVDPPVVRIDSKINTTRWLLAYSFFIMLFYIDSIQLNIVAVDRIWALMCRTPCFNYKLQYVLSYRPIYTPM